MKMTDAHYAALADALDRSLVLVPGGAARFTEDYKDVGCLPKRARWDLLWFSGLKIGDGMGMPGLPLYAYLDDTTSIRPCGAT